MPVLVTVGGVIALLIGIFSGPAWFILVGVAGTVGGILMIRDRSQ